MIIIRVLAGLGNQLFQYALAKSIEAQGQKVYLDIKKPYKDYENNLPYQERKCNLSQFHISIRQINIVKMWQWRYLRRKTILDRFIYYLASQGKWSHLRIDESEFFGRYNKKILSQNGNYYLAGTFQNEKYFKNIRGILLHDLTLKKPLDLPEDIRGMLISRNVVSVHIRRGDYVQHKKIYGLCNKEYYVKAMEYIRDKVELPVFFVFTDDMNEVKKEKIFEKQDDVFYISSVLGLQDYEELMLMSRCKHNIIANSSFSWWGAWLNQYENKIVIAPKVWRKDLTSYSIAPHEWIKI